MRGLFEFVIRPQNKEYNNEKQIDGKNLILNTNKSDHKFVSRIGIVEYTPAYNAMGIEFGDEVIVHHNVFRRWDDIRGNEKKSRNWYRDNLYIVPVEQIFAYKKITQWNALPGYNFIKPIKDNELVGEIVFKDPYFKAANKGDIVGFKPNREYEFNIDEQILYRVPTNSITIKYEHQGKETKYNNSWLQSGRRIS